MTFLFKSLTIFIKRKNTNFENFTRFFEVYIFFFTTDSANSSTNIDSNQTLHSYRNISVEIYGKKGKNPKLTEKQEPNETGVSASTNKRYGNVGKRTVTETEKKRR